MDPKPYRVAVIGGGTAGLASSIAVRNKWVGSERPLQLSILETCTSVGGNNLQFDGVPVFFSCFNHHNGPELRGAMERYGLSASPCDFLSHGMLDRTASCAEVQDEQSDLIARPCVFSTPAAQDIRTECRVSKEALDLLGQPSVTADPETASVASSTRASSDEEGSNRDFQQGAPKEPESFERCQLRHAPARVPISRRNKSWDFRALPTAARARKGTRQGALDLGRTLEEGLCALHHQWLVPAACALQEWVTFGAPVVGKVMEEVVVTMMTAHHDEPRPPLTTEELAAAINYFYSSRDPSWSRAHLAEYYRRNAGTYYYSIENGRNYLLIQAMEKDLMESTGQVSVRLLCGTRCEAIEEASIGRKGVRVSYTQINVGNGEDSARRTTEEFDAVIICVPPHTAAKLLQAGDKSAAHVFSSRTCVEGEGHEPLNTTIPPSPTSAQSFCDLFYPVHAHSCVHTDRSVFREELECKALVYEVSPDGSWVLHIDADKYYAIPEDLRRGNVVSIWYSPDSSPVRWHATLNPAGNPWGSVDPRCAKGEFTAVLSKSLFHDRLGRRAAGASLLGCPGGAGGELEIDSVLGQGLRSYHQSVDTSVFLCSSYWSVEQWTQDCFRLAEEVGEAVVRKGMREAVRHSI